MIPIEEEPIFQITGSRLFKDFQKLREEVGIVNFRWHDLRHEATSRLFEKGLNPIGVTTITGHQDADALYAFKSRGFGGEIGVRDQQETPHKYLVC